MDELKKICKVNKPDLKILVVDSLTGNDVVDQTKSFNDVVGVDGLILTKTDVYEKGGAILSAVFTIKKPILFLGTGQEHEDLEKFDPNKIVERLFE
jgi:fused signal recognition particle receptor